MQNQPNYILLNNYNKNKEYDGKRQSNLCLKPITDKRASIATDIPT
jgi:hypothetical protein